MGGSPAKPAEKMQFWKGWPGGGLVWHLMRVCACGPVGSPAPSCLGRRAASMEKDYLRTLGPQS